MTFMSLPLSLIIGLLMLSDGSTELSSSAPISSIAHSLNTAMPAAPAVSSQRLYFKDLRQWRMGTSEAPADLQRYNGQTVEIVGFMVPFDSIEKIDRFILLQAPFMGCFHVPPPQPNETLMINSQNVKPDYIYEPIRIIGKLTIEETYVDRFLVSLYTIDAIRIEPVNTSDAELEDLPANFHMYGEF
jgi:hypothetical protein